MCFVHGSIDQATSTCRMCKIFKPSGRCPHVTEVCRNRQLHPRGDVVYMKNAEVQTFNGCGYCKWARSNPQSKQSGYQNPGWPGCCRPPSVHEQRLIPAADWPAVTVVHHVPIPADIKAILESLTGQRAAAQLASPSANRGSASPPSQPATLSRRTGNASTVASRIDTSSGKLTQGIGPTKLRNGGSPQQSVASLVSSTSRNSGSDDGAPSLSPASNADQTNSLRRSSVETQAEKRRETSREPRYSPGRKPAELSGTLSRKGSSSKPTVVTSASSAFATKASSDPQVQTRRVLASHNNLPSANSSSISRAVERERNDRDKDRIVAPIPVVRRPRASLDEAVATMSVSGDSSASSSDSGGSETTVISDGGFTDYLSDESEAELQRQAEARAKLLAQAHSEEQEFRAARQQLVNVDLRPPKSWTSNTSSSSRTQGTSSTAVDTPYTAQQYPSTSQSRT